jgi:O-antigen/teichoic acid export membrane protein
MRKELLSLSKDTLIYGGSTVLVRFLSFLLTPFYVNVLASTAEYGIASSLYAYIAFVNVIIPLGLEGAFFRYGSRGETDVREPHQKKLLFSTPFNLVIIASLVCGILVYLAAPSLVHPIFSDSRHDITPYVSMLERILQYSAGIILFDALAILPFADLRIERKPMRFGMIKIANICITVALNLYLVLVLRKGVEGIFIANLIASGVTFLLLLPDIMRKWILQLDRDTLRRMLPFGLTNVPANIAAMMVQVIDRPIVQAYLGLAALGIYQANYRMGFIMMVFVSLFEYAWRPFFMRQHHTDDVKARQIFAKVFTYFMLIALVGFLVLSFFLPYILTTPIFGRSLLRSDYFSGIPIIPVVLLAYVFQGMYTNFIAGIYIAERNRSLPWVTGIGAFVNIVANMLLVPELGILGAAVATLLAYLAMAIAIYQVSSKAYPVPYEWPRIVILFIVTLGSFGFERILILSNTIWREPDIVIFRTGMVLLAIGALFFFGFFSKDEIAFLKGISQRFKPTLLTKWRSRDKKDSRR